MDIGKLPEAVLKRSVLDQLHTGRDEVLLSAAIGEDCAALALGEDEIFVLSTDPITAAADDIGSLAVQITVNDLASAGAEAIGLMLTLLLPPETTEEDVRRVMQEVDAACKDADVAVLGGHTEVTAAVNQILLSVCGVGKAKKGTLILTGGAKPGMDVLVTKWVGLEGTAILAKEEEEVLRTRFPQEFLRTAQEFSLLLSVQKEAKIAAAYGVAAMHDVTEGGIFGALWELAEASKVGLSVQLKEIPIRQETIEICEYFGLNPYELIGSGSMLMAAADGAGLAEELKANGIPAAVIGKITDGSDRVLINGEHRRFLTPPHTDEIYKQRVRR